MTHKDRDTLVAELLTRIQELEEQLTPRDMDDWAVGAVVVSWDGPSLLLEKNGTRRRLEHIDLIRQANN